MLFSPTRNDYLLLSFKVNLVQNLCFLINSFKYLFSPSLILSFWVIANKGSATRHGFSNHAIGLCILILDVSATWSQAALLQIIIYKIHVIECICKPNYDVIFVISQTGNFKK